MRKKMFKPEYEQFLIDNVKGTPFKDLTDLINSKFNTNFTTEQVRAYCGRNHIGNGINCKFQKGDTPFNKGKKQVDYMSEKSLKRTKATRFKNGTMPHNHRPVGSTRITKDGYIEIKVAEPNKWELKHRKVWEEHNGSIPENCCVRFLDCDKTNCNIENLYLVSRAENVEIIRQGLTTDNADINKSAFLVAQLTVSSQSKR